MRSVYSRDNSHSEAKGELIWEYDSQAVLLQAANSKPRQITSGTMPQEARDELATQTIDNIDPLGTNINTSNNKNPEKSGSARHSVANDGGFRSSDPHKEELWAKFIVKIANAHYINTDAAAALLLDHGIRITPRDEQTLVAACVIARNMVRQRNARRPKPLTLYNNKKYRRQAEQSAAQRLPYACRAFSPTKGAQSQ